MSTDFHLVRTFLADRCTFDDDASTDKRDLYAAYVAYCTAHDVERSMILSPAWLGRELCREVRQPIKTKRRLAADGSRVNAWDGIRLKQ